MSMMHCPSSLFSSSNTTLQIRTSGQLVCGKKAPPSSISSTYHIAKKAVQQESNYSFSTVTLLYLYYYTMLQPLSVTVYLHYYTMSTVFYCYCSPTSTTQYSSLFFLLLVYLYYYYYTMLQPLSPLFFYHLSSFNKKLSSHYSPCFPVSHLASLFLGPTV